MAKDDYHVIVFRILAYLYACLKAGEDASREYLHYDTDAFPINERYWSRIWVELINNGYVDGVHLVPIMGNDKGIKFTSKTTITEKGIVYLHDNNMMAKAKSFLKSVKEIVPGL